MRGEGFERQLGRFLAWERSLPMTAELSDLGEANTFSGAPRTFDAWYQNARSNASLINKVIFESLFQCFGLSAISSYAAMKSYQTLMALLRIEDRTNPLTVATTNYDFAAETALQQLGFRPDWGEEPRTQISGGSPPVHLENLASAIALGRTPVLHLHGRVGWYRQPNGQLVSISPDAPYIENYGLPGLLLPDPDKNYGEDEHFRVVWEEFRKAIESAARILVLGHSLNDAGLCKALKPAIGGRLRVTMCVEGDAGQPRYEEEAQRIMGLLPDLPKEALINMKFGPIYVPDGSVRATFEHWNG